MAPYFETAKSFADVPITDDGVDTATFLLASTDFVNMFDLLGGGVFAFVQNDLRSNIGGVRHRYEAAIADSPTLEKLAIHERKNGHRDGTASLVRLIRGLWFTCEALRNMQEDRNAELHVCFRRSYDAILKPRLSFVVRPVVSVAIRAVPHRHDFYARLVQGGSHEKFDSELTKWLAGLEVIILRMKDFLAQGDYGMV
ncbi:glycolipid transfer protein [Lentinus tigrinus ALCF2SS1-7]|uniref:Glycolipid transfer protein n=1 Tax=Lentinus tigrinus ALCF2SS1-6 TaxID=1328759 RepID=A0A5C2SKC4_9APHY|nr:glycolipid transfer protein [Lentinus tigrinus ALCF2SS1-6]RPD76281.1 glycolipid transfer protein [Lentinus tigrinus ALCF2SS1-7]